jgi:hypothetical protein
VNDCDRETLEAFADVKAVLEKRPEVLKVRDAQKEPEEPGPQRQPIPRRNRAVEARQTTDMERVAHHRVQISTQSDPQLDHALRTVRALEKREDSQDAEHGQRRQGRAGTHGP